MNDFERKIRATDLGLKILDIIDTKLNKDSHGFIKLSITAGKLKKISWEAGELPGEE
jgi:hypothetical protein